MVPSHLLDFIKSKNDTQTGWNYYNNFFHPSGNTADKSTWIYKINCLLDDYFHSYRITDDSVRNSLKKDIFENYTAQTTLIEHIYYWCQSPEAEGPAKDNFITRKDTYDYAWIALDNTVHSPTIQRFASRWMKVERTQGVTFIFTRDTDDKLVKKEALTSTAVPLL